MGKCVAKGIINEAKLSISLRRINIKLYRGIGKNGFPFLWKKGGNGDII